MDSIENLVKHVVTTRYESLPAEAIQTTKRGILDTIGVLIAGATAPGCNVMIDLVREWGGKEESTILVHGGKVPAYNAAMVNSVMARALDFDDSVEKGMHLGASAIPTALAVAEMCGNLSGKELLAAVLLGEDLAVRINMATTQRGFDPTGVCMVFGTTAVAGRIMGLDQERMLNALGIAFNEAAGSFQSNIDGALVVRAIQGFTSRSGILAAVLAQKGITGVKNILQGIYGYFQLFSASAGDMDALFAGLGQEFGVNKLMYKKYPSCGATLNAVEAVLELRREYDISPDEIARIDVYISQSAYNLVGRPFEIRDNPVVDAQFSIQYAVASALLRGGSKLEHFTDRFIRDPEIIKLAGKVHPVVGTEAEGLGDSGGCFMEIKMKGGAKYSRFMKYHKGTPANPLTDEEIREKFTDCMAFATKGLPEKNIDGIIAAISGLENVEDISGIIRLCSA